MLKVTDVKKTFFKGTVNEKKAIRGISLTLNDGDFCTVIGSNGAGKSTLLNLIAGTLIPDKGLIGKLMARMLPECLNTNGLNISVAFSGSR